MIVENIIAGKPVFLSYLDGWGSYFGEMALDDSPPQRDGPSLDRSELESVSSQARLRRGWWPGAQMPRWPKRAEAEVTWPGAWCSNAFHRRRKDSFSSLVSTCNPRSPFPSSTNVIGVWRAYADFAA